MENPVGIVENFHIFPIFEFQENPKETKSPTEVFMPEKKTISKSGILTTEALAAEIKSGAIGSYIFFGDEDYLKSHYRDQIYGSVMEEGLEVFNYFPISFSPAVQTKEEAMSRLADAVQAIPVMQDKKLIVASDLSPASLSKDLLDALASILKRANESDDTVCVLYLRADELEADYKFETSPLCKKLSPCAKMVRFDLQPRGKLISWTKRHFSGETILIADEAAGTLVDLCAGRMTPLSFEIEKLICYAKYVKGGEPPRVEYDDVIKIAVPSAQDEVPFAMLNAAQSWKLTEMLAVLNTAREQREEPVPVLARLSRIYLDMLLIKTAHDAALSPSEIAKTMKMKDFRVSKYLSSIAKVPLSVIENAVRLSYETDRALKSTPQDPWILLDELAVKIYAPKSLRTANTVTTNQKI